MDCRGTWEFLWSTSASYPMVPGLNGAGPCGGLRRKGANVVTSTEPGKRIHK